MADLESIAWKEINPETLKAMRVLNVYLAEILSSVDPMYQYSTTKREIFLKRKDGKIGVYPKDGTAPYCAQCVDQVSHRAPLGFFTKLANDNKEHKGFYCLNEELGYSPDK